MTEMRRHRAHSHQRMRWGSLACAVGLVLGACGNDDKPAASSAASTAAPTSTEAAPSSTAAPESSTAPTDAPSSTDAPTAERGPGDFGTLKDVCGPGDASGATDQGVSDTEIVMGTVSDPGNAAAPGLNQELFDAGEAFVKWCNDAGGINGRKIKLNLHDAKLFEAGAAMVASCQTDFMLVGGGMALDAAGVEPRVDCGLPQIASYLVSKEAGRAEGSIEAIVDNDSNSHNEPWLKTLIEQEPDLADKLALWNLDLPSVTPTGNRAKNAAIGLGYTVAVEEILPSAVDNWRPYIEKLKEKDIQVILNYGNPFTFVAAMKAMNDVGYFPKYIFQEGNFYDTTFIAGAGDLLDKTTVFVNGTDWPFELASENPATQDYIDMLHALNPKLEPKLLGANSTSAWLLWAVAARDCGSDLTRDCVMDTATAMSNWDGGGLHAPNKPGPTSGEMSECATLLRATPGGFVIDDQLLTPNDRIWDCRPGKFSTVADT